MWDSQEKLREHQASFEAESLGNGFVSFCGR